MALAFTALFCHAPIVIPAVGGARGAACAQTTAAMRALAQQLVRAQPDVVVVVSPHTPRPRDGVVMVGSGARVDFSAFGADVAFSLPGISDPASLVAAARAAEVRVVPADPGDAPIDHGAAVPLAFLHEAGWRGPTVVIGLPRSDALGDAQRIGRAIAQWSHGARVALVASGDGSHRLQPGAPAGFHADAHRFDRAVLERLTGADDAALLDVEEDLRELAAEDILSSVVVATSAAGRARGRSVLSYEAPFGVGYTVAVLDDPGPPSDTLRAPPRALLKVARASLAAHFRGEALPPLPDLDVRAHGVMVSWHDAEDGEQLRGCLGHVPARAPIVESVAALAVAAATQDPRFAELKARELDAVRATVTLVGAPETVEDGAALDPKHWGIEVSAGQRRGILLPDLEGVDDAAQQLAITLRKARIHAHEPYVLRRFRAVALTEGRP